EVKAAVAKAHDDLARSVLHAEAHDFLTAAAHLAATAPEPAQSLCFGGSWRHRHECRESQGSTDRQCAGGSVADHSPSPVFLLPPHWPWPVGSVLIFSIARAVPMRSVSLCPQPAQNSSFATAECAASAVIARWVLLRVYGAPLS